MGSLTLDNGVDSVVFTEHWSSWQVFELWRLVAGPAVRGSDRVLPGAQGVRPFRRLATVTEYGLPIIVSGDVAPQGVASQVGEVEQTALNVDWLIGRFMGLPNPGTVAATLTLGDSSWSGDVHVTGVEPSGGGLGWWRGTLALSIPAGRLEVSA